MSDFDLDWGMEHELHVDHDGGVDHVPAFDHDHDAYSHDHDHDLSGEDDLDGLTDAPHDEPPTLDEQEIELPDWQLDTDFLDGHYDLVGADPHENDMWSQFMSDMHEEVNPYAAN
ncbi:hypothetical protein ACQP00_05575 [Dactylosporangium sp. CS-047395]|uniref:hypothetical protein n=1 Tax=Dactylosporangium sp. CS-047395 TaxID=3239936 RepID=UPI003D93221D